MKFFETFTVALATVPAVLAAASYRSNSNMFKRQTSTTSTCQIQLAAGNGGRKVAIVLDSSGSMTSTDPQNLRIVAGKALNAQLVPASGATGGKTADLVTVVDFDDTAKVIYPLGDPAGATTSFDKIDSSGGTFIADGVNKAVAELTKPGNDPTAGRSGIVVLTDGEDSSVNGLITAINNAGTAGIRVSFGFLKTSTSAVEPKLLTAILKTGGSYASFSTADAIQAWMYLILSNGITAADNGASGSSAQPLLSGITVAKLTGSQPVAFSYAAQAGEKLVFSIASLSAQELTSDLADAAGTVVGSNKTARSGSSSIAYDATAAGTLKLTVTALNSTSEGVFQVTLNSSLGISGCNLTQNTGPSPNTSTTVTVPTPTPTPTSTKPPVATAAAARFGAPVAAALFFAALML